jgi:fatty acid hydroxylase domain-containing protein 2
VFVTFGYTTLMYWTVGILFIIMDITNQPKCFRKYKTQPEAHVPLDVRKFLLACRVVLFNQLVVNIVYSHIITKVEMTIENRLPLRETTSFFRLFTDYVLFQLIYEFGFFYSHWIMHSKYLYKYIHKMHHEWTGRL